MIKFDQLKLDRKKYQTNIKKIGKNTIKLIVKK